MTRHNALCWSRFQFMCMAIGGIIGFVLELIGVVSAGSRIGNLAIAAFVALFGTFAAIETHQLLRHTKD